MIEVTFERFRYVILGAKQIIDSFVIINPFTSVLQ